MTVIINGSGTANGISFFSSPTTFGGTLATATQGISTPSLPAGTILQVVNYQTGAVATGTGTIPIDDTIPQNTEGTQFMSLAITPKSTTSKLKIDVIWMGSSNYAGAVNIGIALFQDSNANALAAQFSTAAAQNYRVTIPLTYYMASGTTSSTTFYVRAGGGGAGTTTINGYSGNREFGGVMASSITIIEIAA